MNTNSTNNLSKILKEKLKNADKDFDWNLDQYLEKKQYNKNSDILINLVDSFFEEDQTDSNIEIKILIRWQGKEYDHLMFMFHEIDKEKDDYSFILRVILDKYKKEAFDDEFLDTHGQKCKVYFDKDRFYLGIYNTGRMVDFKINPEPPWRDDACNQDVDGVMALGKNQLTYLIPLLETYCENRGLDISDEGKFKDLNSRDCSIGYSSVATYEGCWIGLCEYNRRMHMNIPKMKNILEKMKNFMNQ